MQREIVSNSVEETVKIGEELAELVSNNEKVLIKIDGDLGVGKTQLVKGLAKGLGVKETVKSPSYGYLNEYQLEEILFVHVDAWRIDSKVEADSLNLERYYQEPGKVILAVEWPENYDFSISNQTEINVKIVEQSSGQRLILISTQ